MRRSIKLLLPVLIFSLMLGFSAEREQLSDIYQEKCTTRSDIYQHLPTLKALAAQCPRVVEIGVRSIVSTWALLEGLAENPDQDRFYLGIDIVAPPQENWQLAKYLAESEGISFFFWQKNDMDVELEEIDLLFIDSLHTYCHLTYELEKFAPQVQKYIAMHDTSPPWGFEDEFNYDGDFSEYPAWIDRSKRGLWPAVKDFLKRHPEWKLKKRYRNNHGFTILMRSLDL